MTKAAWASLAVLLLVLVLAGVLTGNDDKQFTVTSFGRLPVAYGAVFDLLAELGLPVSRSYAPTGDLPSTATVWWIRPSGLCADGPGASAPGEAPNDAAAAEEGWDGRAWVENGGTAVVFLPQLGHGAACASIAGLAVPARLPYDERHPEATDDMEALAPGGAARAPRGDDWRRSSAELETQAVDGALVPRRRELRGPGFTAFAAPGTWQVRATLGERPFVLQQERGAGRVVLVADARVFSNAWLASADAAPLALDLVRAYGVPRLDERAHGLRAEDSALIYLASSPAAFVFVGLALVGAVFAWRGTAWPARTIGETSVGAPALEAFVDSLAELYARTGDYRRVRQRYRELSLARLRRHFRLPPDTPAAVLLMRLRDTRRVRPERIALLTDDSPVPGEAALQAQVRALDSLVREASR